MSSATQDKRKKISRGTKADFQKAIMEKGFFPEGLPPCFQVQGFFDASRSLGFLDEEHDLRNQEFELAPYNDTKRGFQRRVFSCPNPIFYIEMAVFLGKYRRSISKFLNEHGKHFSCSVPHWDRTEMRALSIKSYSEFEAIKRKELATFQYLVKTDTSRFYHSLYTHAIAWAYCGKEQAKKARKARGDDRQGAQYELYKTMDRLDVIVRTFQRQQTIGIPVGPDVSGIIAEIVSVAIDKQFKANFGGHITGVRLIDDVVFGAESESNAKKILNDYRDAVRHFELDINENKTQIIQSKFDLQDYSAFSIKRDLKASIGNHNTLDSGILENIIRITNERHDDGMIRFAIRQIDTLGKENSRADDIWEKNWGILEPFLMKVAINYTHSLPYVVKVLISRIRSVDKEKWKGICQRLLRKHAPLGYDSEVVWSCWLLRHLRKYQKMGGNPLINEVSLDLIMKKAGPFSALIATDLAQGEAKEVAKSAIQKRLSSDNCLFESDWILAYECERLFGYSFQHQNDSFYEILKNLMEKNVQFYSRDIPESEGYEPFSGVSSIYDVDFADLVEGFEPVEPAEG